MIFGNELTDPLKLERTLIEPVTLQIIAIHQSERMQKLGYRPIVDRWSAGNSSGSTRER